MSKLSKSDRLAIFYDRLRNLPPAGTEAEALEQLTTTLNRVEDEYSGVEFDADSFGEDGRLYPPKGDNGHEVPRRPSVMKYRHRLHNTFIGSNGAILIQTIGRTEVFSKKGADGLGIWDLDAQT